MKYLNIVADGIEYQSKLHPSELKPQTSLLCIANEQGKTACHLHMNAPCCPSSWNVINFTTISLSPVCLTNHQCACGVELGGKNLGYLLMLQVTHAFTCHTNIPESVYGKHGSRTPKCSFSGFRPTGRFMETIKSYTSNYSS